MPVCISWGRFPVLREREIYDESLLDPIWAFVHFFFFLNRLEKSAIYNGEIVESAVLPTQNRMIRVVSCFFLWNGVFVVSTIRANLG